MSLFPAYAAEEAQPVNNNSESWLQNPSFISVLTEYKFTEASFQVSDSDSDEHPLSPASNDSEPIKKHKVKKRRKKEPKIKEPPEVIETDEYVVDRKRDLGYLNMDRQSKKGKPRYEKPKKALPGVIEAKFIQLKMKKPKRYFSGKAIKTGQDDEAASEELKKTTEELNKAVHDDPHNVEKWLQLVDFQEDFLKFQAIQFRTSGERDRAISGQKLAILERAMASNPGHEGLQKTWLSLAQRSADAEEVENKLKKMGGESLVLLLGKVMLTQMSLPRCTSSAVLKAYCGVMEDVQRAKHLTADQQDFATIELLWHACTFLEQCGLWEMAWMAYGLTLSLNLALEVPAVCVDDDVVLEEENRILEASAGVPVWHLWRKLETLRQSHHFLPVTNSENYPQRVVTAGEVSGLVYHTRRLAHFRLLLLLPILSNIPLLPRSHTLLKTLTSQTTGWLLDSVEWHLSAVFTNTPLLKFDTGFLTRQLPLSQVPQYLNEKTGQLEFLNLALESFSTALQATSDRQRVAIGCWYLRFLRWLDLLRLSGRYQPPNGFSGTKALFKGFLQMEGNRDVILYYVEYAMWQFECGHTSSAIKTLITLIKSKGDVLSQFDEDVKSDLCYVYRILCEIYIVEKLTDEAKAILLKLCSSPNAAIGAQKFLIVANDCKSRLDSEVSLEAMMLPDWKVSWLTCCEIFKALEGSPHDGFMEEVISSAGDFRRERLLESCLAIRRQFSKKLYTELPIAQRLLREFPLNPVACNAIANYLVNGGGLWWKDLAYMITDPESMAAVIAVCCVMERQQRKGGPDNRCAALLDKLTGSRASVMVHRIQFARLAETGDVKRLEAARILALEATPWNKSVYMDAIAVSPPQLLPLTDLIVEKDLRIHITPDEIETLRD